MNFSVSYLQSRVIKYWVHYLLSMWPRLKSWTRHHMWDEIFLLACKCRHIFCCRFSPGKKVRSDYWKYICFCRLFFSRHLVFPSPQKTTMFSKFQFDQGCGRQRTTMWMYTVHVLLLSMFVLFVLNQSIILTLWFCHVNTGYHYIYHNFGNFLVELLLTNIYSEG